MKRSDKLKVLIDSIKTANELMRKQIEINGRAVELLGEFITEPESLGKAPYSDNVPSLPNMVGFPLTINPKDMVRGEWYLITKDYIDEKCQYLIKFNRFLFSEIDYFFMFSLRNNTSFKNLYLTLNNIESIRPATQKEILKYFPNELEVDTHGGNDAAYIQEVTDPQV